jgi:TetR/AcrR family transcriptional regulator
MNDKKKNRKQDILQNLAFMLENELSDRITTAKLAKQVGVSEAALYRHFPSKARMYESLLDFSEESIFGLIKKIDAEPLKAVEKIYQISHLLLGFSQKNPGISRLLTGEVLLGEPLRLKERISQLFDRLELELKQIHRNEAVKEGHSSLNSAAVAKLVTSILEGRIQQFVRSKFKILPTEHWDAQWKFIQPSVEQLS